MSSKLYYKSGSWNIICINCLADVGSADCAVVVFDNGLRPQNIGDK